MKSADHIGESAVPNLYRLMIYTTPYIEGRLTWRSLDKTDTLRECGNKALCLGGIEIRGFAKTKKLLQVLLRILL